MTTSTSRFPFGQSGTVLVGAGISVAAPSDVPSWWHFNNEVLHTIIESTMGALTLGDDLVSAIVSLQLDDVGVAQFSQIVHDSFAGPGWFQLLTILEGHSVNDGHLALADLVRTGQVRTILTTNFDTLIERALTQLGVDFQILVPNRDSAPAALEASESIRLIKLHGSIETDSTLVDLANQKTAGFSVEWLSWLRRTYESASITVMGFSGRDLELSEDYLGLFSASERIRSIAWLTSDGRVDVPAVKRLIELCGDRAQVIEGSLPSFLLDAVGKPATGTQISSSLDGRESVRDRFAALEPHFLECAVATSRLLTAAGSAEQASLLRDTVRSEIQRRYARAEFRDAVAVKLTYAQFGADEVSTRPDLARECLTLSLNLDQAIYDSRSEWSPDAERERAENRSGSLVNLAMTALVLDDRASAHEALEAMCRINNTLPEGQMKSTRSAQELLIKGGMAVLDSNHRQSAISFRTSAEYFEIAGNRAGRESALISWAQALEMLGEPDAAREIADTSSVDLSRVPVVTLLARAKTEWGESYGRFDEVWFGITVDALESFVSRSQIAEAIKELIPTPAAVASSRVLVNALGALLGETDLSLIDYPTSDPEGSDKRNLLVHDALVPAITELAKLQANEGIRLYRSSNGKEAWRALARLLLAARAFEIVNKSDDAVQARIYAVDCLQAERQAESARRLLDEVLRVAPGHLLPVAAARYVRLLCDEAYLSANEGDSASAESRVKAVRQEFLTSGPDAAIAARTHAYFLRSLGREDDASRVFDEAVELSIDTNEYDEILTSREKFRRSQKRNGSTE